MKRTYQIACYIVDGNGIQTGITSGSCQMKAPNIYLEAKDAAGTEKRISNKSDKCRSVWRYPSGTVCGMERTGGQDDLIWYGAEKKECWYMDKDSEDQGSQNTWNV